MDATNAKSEGSKAWWQTLPAIIGSIATLVTAIAVLIPVLMNNNNNNKVVETPQPKPSGGIQTPIVETLQRQREGMSAQPAVPVQPKVQPTVRTTVQKNCLVTALKQHSFEFTWPENGSPKTVTIVASRFSEKNDSVVLYYKERGGGELRATVYGRRLIGTWQDSGVKGPFEVEFDESCVRAEGWWSNQGASQRNPAYMQRVIPQSLD